MENLVDNERLNRVHVKNVRIRNGYYYIVLSDNSLMTWELWINGGCKEIRDGKPVEYKALDFLM
jgi:hypothetical protein